MIPKIKTFDIETGPADEETLARFEPAFAAPSNYKDPEKILANIIEQKVAWREKAALSSLTGRVLAVGILDNDRPEHVKTILGYEGDVIRETWADIGRGGMEQIVGFNSHTFDIPFLVRRSWALGIAVPMDTLFYGPRIHGRFIDLRNVWSCGDRSATISLDNLAKLLGLPGKNGHGSEFAGLLAADPEAAIGYLINDVKLTHACAIRLGVIPGGAL